MTKLNPVLTTARSFAVFFCRRFGTLMLCLLSSLLFLLGFTFVDLSVRGKEGRASTRALNSLSSCSSPGIAEEFARCAPSRNNIEVDVDQRLESGIGLASMDAMAPQFTEHITVHLACQLGYQLVSAHW